MTPMHVFTKDALGDLDALGVAGAIASGQVSRQEVLEAAIARVERIDAQLCAVQVACFDRARAQPVVPGVFAGVPTFVKDNVDVRGLPTCAGSAAITPHPARHDAPPARQFLAQGFVLLGKSTLPEFGLTASTEWVGRAPTRNPWNRERSAGASSGGSAVLVASGAVPIAHANDGGGSIRIPAAVNGLVGLKGTRGRLLDQHGARQLPVNLACEGVLTRTVRDTAHYLAAAERYHPNVKLKPVGLVQGPADRRLRIGVIRTDMLGNPVHRDIEAVLSSAVATLAREGHHLAETRLRLGEGYIEDFKLYWAAFAVVMTAAYMVVHGRNFDPRELDPFTRGLAGLVRRRPLAVVYAIRRLRQGERIYDEHFTDFDVLLSPVLAQPAPRIGEHAPDQPFEELFAKLTAYVAFTPFSNVGGGPAVAIPHGMMSDGLPGSIHLSAPRGGER
ncbi:MAG TPA: amidase, partial [Mycobacterium sp.]|nr:amidase [Mycobacterium sp.]